MHEDIGIATRNSKMIKYYADYCTVSLTLESSGKKEPDGCRKAGGGGGGVFD